MVGIDDINCGKPKTESELYGSQNVTIYGNSKSSKWKKFRIDEKPYNDVYHSLMSHLKDKKFFGIVDIKEWLGR